MNLLPCPFCGSDPLWDKPLGGFQAECSNRKCGGMSGIFPTKPMATRAWNNRHAKASPAEPIGALGTALTKSRQWVEANTAQVRGVSAQAAAPGEAMLAEIDAALALVSSPAEPPEDQGDDRLGEER